MPPQEHQPFSPGPYHQPMQPPPGPQANPQPEPPQFMNPSVPQPDWQQPSPPAAVPPSWSQPVAPQHQPQPGDPMPVVKVLSTRGVEYAMMTLALWFGADALIAILLILINGGANFTDLSFPLAVLLVTLPTFAWFFLRLKRAELANPALRLDPSKRRWTQITQIFTFIASLATIIGFIYIIVAKIGGAYHGSLGKAIADYVVILVIAGGILWYYWADEHKR